MLNIENLVSSTKLDDSDSNNLNLWVVESIRVGFYLFAVITSIVAQVLNPYFLNFNIWLPVFLCVIFGLVLHFGIILLYQKVKIYKYFELSIFIVDALFIAAFNYYTYFSYPFFTVLFLLNIALSSFVLGGSYSVLVAGASTLFYTVIYLARFSGAGIDQITYLLNILTFYISAILSGYLGDLLISRSRQLNITKTDLLDLKTLSQVIIKNIGVGLVSYEKNKSVSFSNTAAQNILGSQLDNKANVIKKSILFDPVENKQQTKRQELDLDIHGIRKNLELITTYIPDVNLQTKWILLVQDLTEIKSLQKELMLKEKLAAIGQLAGGIAHEIRNPLASISGSVEMLKESTRDLNPENTKLFSIIIKEIDRLNLLITDFLSFVRPEVKRSDLISLKSLIEDILALVKFDKKLSENVTFETDMSDIAVKCDQGKLKQAFINIVTNALQAMGNKDGSVFICRVKHEGYFASVEFTDNGPGMNESTVEKILEPFYTTKEKGTGLGLAITHRIIEGHEGALKIFSNEKKGTTFFIRLPIK